MRTLLIFNPVAGRHPARHYRRLTAAAKLLAGAGWQVDWAETEPGTGGRLPAQRGVEEGYDLLLTSGGDGTIAQVAASLIEARLAGNSNTPALGLLPGGTANVYAREFGIPFHPTQAVQRLLRARRSPVPAGRARFPDGRQQFFLALASAGFDAHVVHTLSSAAKKRWGKLAFVGTALRESFRYGFPTFQAAAEGHPEQHADLALFALTRYYAGGFRFVAKRPALTPALLLMRSGPLTLPLQSTLLVAGQLHHAPGAHLWNVPSLRLCGAPVPLELDGEDAGSTPVTLDVIPEALELLV